MLREVGHTLLCDDEVGLYGNDVGAYLPDVIFFQLQYTTASGETQMLALAPIRLASVPRGISSNILGEVGADTFVTSQSMGIDE